jgi:hypothetical protein
MPRSLYRQQTVSLRRETDVDDDSDAVGQREVTAEFTLHYIEVLTLARGDSES